jgi:hypothetical protein
LLTDEAYRALEAAIEQLGEIIDWEIRRPFQVEREQPRPGVEPTVRGHSHEQ